MDGHFPATQEDLYQIHMDLRHVQSVQTTHAERITRLERKQADDAALKSVWTSPFPSVLTGTPQQAPIQTPNEGVFDDFDDEHCQNLLGSLQLDTEEPVRRGASRANSVRFDVSATQGASWGHNSRPSGEFTTRPNSGFGNHPMERTLSHKSDGRHSSAHSVHSVHSGRTSSLGLSNHFVVGDPDDTHYDMPQPPPGLFILGSVPTIIRCWLTEHFFHSSLLYAVVCTGSQKSTVEYGLLKDIGLEDQIHKDAFGLSTIRLPVYLPEAIVTQPSSRPSSPTPQLPTLTVTFEVTGSDRPNVIDKKCIRIFIGSDTLRTHSADLLLSQNCMTLYADDRNKLSVPFVRPEDDGAFKNICTGYVVREKVTLKGTAAPFTPSEKRALKEESTATEKVSAPAEAERGRKPAISSPPASLPPSPPRTEKSPVEAKPVETETKDSNPAEPRSEDTVSSDAKSANGSTKQPLAGHTGNRESIGGIWGSWRSGNAAGMDNDAVKEFAGSSRYEKPLSQKNRTMKVLKPSKATTTVGRSVSGGTRTGNSYEPAPQSPLEDGQARRKSHSTIGESTASLRWDAKKAATEEKSLLEIKPISGARTPNPIGTASAFSWMKPSNTKATAGSD